MITEQLSQWLWDAGWQSAVVGAAALLIAAAVGRRRPGLAYGIILLALVKFLIPPLLPIPGPLRASSLLSPRTVTGPTSDVRQRMSAERLLPAGDERDRQPSSAWDLLPGAEVADGYFRAGSEAAGDTFAVQATTDAAADSAGESTGSSWLMTWIVIYFLGVGVTSCWIVIGWWRVRRLLAAASSPSVAMAELWQQTHQQVMPPRTVRLLLSDAQVTPLAFGLLRPVVVFPRGLLEILDRPQQQMVLTHELLHHRRRDPWAIALELGVIALWWFHPVAWLLIRSSRNGRERCCDAATVQLLDRPPVQYAGVLERVAQWLANQPTHLAFTSATMHPIGTRIRHLLHLSEETRPMKLRTLFSLLAIWALVCLPTLRTGEIGSATSGRTHASDDLTPAAPPQAAAGSAAVAEQTSPDSGASSDDVTTDRYGDVLPPGAIARLGTSRLRHAQMVRCVAFSPNGRIIASGGLDGVIRLWDPETGKDRGTLTGTVHQITEAMAFSPDGTLLVSTSEPGLVRLWDVATGVELWKQQTVDRNIVNVVFFPDGLRFATAGGQDGAVDSAVRIWNVASGEQTVLFNFPIRSPQTFGLAISSDGSKLACGGLQSIFIFDLLTGTDPLVIENGHGRDIVSLAFTPDGTELISAGQSERVLKTDDRGQRVLESFAEIRSWNVADGTLIRNYIGDEKDTYSAAIALNDDGRTLVSYHLDHLHVWNRSTGERLRTIALSQLRHGPRSQVVALAPEQTLVAVASAGRHDVQLWNWQTGERHLPFTDTHHGMVRILAYSPDGSRIATADTGGEFRLWDAQTQQMTKLLPLSSEHQASHVRALAFSPDGRFLAAVGDEHSPSGFGGVVTLWQQDGTQVWSQSFAGRGASLAFSADGQRIAVAQGLGMVMLDRGDTEPIVSIYTAASGMLERQIEGLHQEVLAMQFSADGATLQIVDRKMVSTWDSQTGEKRNEFAPTAEYERGIGHAAFAPGGTMIATSAHWEQLVVLSDLTSGEEITRFSTPNTRGNQLCFSADGKQLVTASTRFVMTRPGTDVNVHFWDPATGAHLAALDVGADPPSGLALHPDGEQIATGMAEGFTLLWDLSLLDNLRGTAP